MICIAPAKDPAPPAVIAPPHVIVPSLPVFRAKLPLPFILPAKDPKPPIDILPPVVIDVTAVVPPTCIPEAKDDVPPTVKVFAICMVPAKLAFPSDSDIVAWLVAPVESFIVKSPFAVRPPLVLKPDAKKPTPSLLIEAFLDPLSVVTPLYIEIPP